MSHFDELCRLALQMDETWKKIVAIRPTLKKTRSTLAGETKQLWFFGMDPAGVIVTSQFTHPLLRADGKALGKRLHELWFLTREDADEVQNWVRIARFANQCAVFPIANMGPFDGNPSSPPATAPTTYRSIWTIFPPQETQDLSGCVEMFTSAADAGLELTLMDNVVRSMTGERCSLLWAPGRKRLTVAPDEPTEGFAMHEIIMNEAGNPCDYRFLVANPAFSALTGTDLKAVVGRRLLEVFPNIEKSWIDRYGKIALTGSPEKFTQYSPFLGRAYTVDAFSPRLGLFVTVFRDETSRERQTAYAASQVHSAPVPSALLSPSGDYIAVNESWERLIGTTLPFVRRMSVLGQRRIKRKVSSRSLDTVTVTDATTSPADGAARSSSPPPISSQGEAWQSRCHEIQGGRFVTGSEELIELEGGRKEYVTFFGMPWRWSGEMVLGVWFVFHVVTEGVEARKKREELEATAKRTEAKMMYLSSFEHELRTPLQAIVSSLEVLGDGEGSMNEKQVDSLRSIEESTQALLEVTSNSLDFVKGERMPLDVEKEPVNLRKMLEGIGTMLSQRAAGKGVDLVMYVDPSLPEQVFTDPLHLREVCTNLVSNAVKYTKEGSIVCRAKEGDEPGRLVIEVEDTGIGIAADGQRKLFQPFAKLDRFAAGTGLGLYNTRQRAEALGGEVNLVRSSPGCGTLMRFELPNCGIEAKVGVSDPVQVGERRYRVYVESRTSGMGEVLEGYLHGVVEFVGTESESEVSIVDEPADDRSYKSGVRYIVVVRRQHGLKPMPGRGLVLVKPVRYVELLEGIENLMDDEAAGPSGTRGRRRRGSDGGERGWGYEKKRKAGSEALSGLRVAVVDDTEITRRVLDRLVHSIGVGQVELFEGGMEIVQSMREYGNFFDMIIMDCVMPGIDGFEATRRIREIDRSVPIIGLSGLTSEEARLQATSCGMNAYLTKPVLRERMLDVVLALGVGKGAKSSS